jgi:hypothetical protein
MPLDVPTRVAASPSHVSSEVTAIDISLDGVLVAFAEPVGLLHDQQVVVSLGPAGDWVHLTGRVKRVEHGLDFRTYAAIEFDPADESERQRILEHVAPSSPN